MQRAVMLFAVLLWSGWCSAQSMYRCVDERGQSTFSGQPCGDNAESIRAYHPPIGSDFAPSERWQAEQELKRARREQAATEQRYQQAREALVNAPCRDFSSSELRTLVIRNQVVVGMPSAEAFKAWGRPSAMSGGWQNAYHWDNGASSYFYIKNGCVETVQGSYKGR